MKIALVHEWLVTYAGSEKVLSAMVEEFPEADIFCLIDSSKGAYKDKFRHKEFKTTFLQKLAGLPINHRNLFPLMPLAVEQIDLRGYDVVVSNSHAVAKGVITGPDQLHVCYCYTPMRYAWDLQEQYLSEQGLSRGIRGAAARLLLHRSRLWDIRTANGVDHFIACSSYIARRIRKVYRRDAEVIYPGVDTDFYGIGDGRKEEFYLTASRLVPYKKVALIVEAFNQMPERRLVVIGDGPQYRRIAKSAGPNVEVLGYRHNQTLRDYLRSAKAFVFAAEEDFGIAPLEAQACGTPVLAYGRGGACETVLHGKTGLHFHEQSTSAIRNAVERFEELPSGHFEPSALREHAKKFSQANFRQQFRNRLTGLWDNWSANLY